MATQTKSSTAIYLGPPSKSPFAPAGTYVTSKGTYTYAGGEAVRGKEVSGAGGSWVGAGGTPTPSAPASSGGGVAYNQATDAANLAEAARRQQLAQQQAELQRKLEAQRLEAERRKANWEKAMIEKRFEAVQQKTFGWMIGGKFVPQSAVSESERARLGEPTSQMELYGWNIGGTFVPESVIPKTAAGEYRGAGSPLASSYKFEELKFSGARVVPTQTGEPTIVSNISVGGSNVAQTIESAGRTETLVTAPHAAGEYYEAKKAPMITEAGKQIRAGTYGMEVAGYEKYKGRDIPYYKYYLKSEAGQKLQLTKEEEAWFRTTTEYKSMFHELQAKEKGVGTYGIVKEKIYEAVGKTQAAEIAGIILEGIKSPFEFIKKIENYEFPKIYGVQIPTEATFYRKGEELYKKYDIENIIFPNWEKSSVISETQKEKLKAGTEFAKELTGTIYGKYLRYPIRTYAGYKAIEVIGAGWGLTKTTAAGMVTPYKEALVWGGVISKDTEIAGLLGKTIKVGVIAGMAGITTKTLTERYIETSRMESPAKAKAELVTSLLEIGVISKQFSKGERYITEPIVTKQIPQKIEARAIEAQTMKETFKGDIDTYAKYKMGVLVTPKQIEISSRGKVFLGEPPIKELAPISKPRYYEFETPFESKLGEEFVLVGKGPRLKYISMISGEGEMIELKSLTGLSKIDKMIAQELAGKREIKAPEKFTTKLIPKEAEIQKGFIEEQKVYKGARKGEWGELTLKEFVKGMEPYGKRRTINQYLSEIEQVKKIGRFKISEEEPFEVYKGKLVSKETSMPFARAAGKTQKIESIIFRAKEPIPYKKPVAQFDFKEPEIKANLPSEKSIQKQIQIQKQVQIKEMPKFIPKEIIKQIQVSRKIKAILEPTKSESAYAFGKTLFYKTLTPATDLLYPSIKTRIGITERVSHVSVMQPIQMREIMQEKQIMKGVMQEKFQEKEVMKERMQEKQIMKTMIQEKQISKSLMQEKLMERQLERQVQKERQLEKIKSLFRKTTTEKDITRDITREIPKEKIITFPEFHIHHAERSMLAEPSFETFIIEKKKPKIIAAGLTEAQALDIGARVVAKSLRATFGIRASREPLRKAATYGEFGRIRELFREPAVKSPYRKLGRVYVQKKVRVGRLAGRLAFPEERIAIQAARRIKLGGIR